MLLPRQCSSQAQLTPAVPVSSLGGRGLRQHLITIICYMLRVPFALLDSVCYPFTRQARQHPRSIVVIKPCCLGDVLMTTPFLEVIHRTYPQATITYVVGTWSKVVAEHQPAIDRVMDSGTVGIPGRYSFFDYMKLVRVLRKQHFDLAFVLDRSPRLTLLPWLVGVPRRVGPDSLGRGFSLTDRVAVSSSPAHLQHQVEIYLDLARKLDLTIDHPRMSFEPTEEERRAALPPSPMRVALFPGGGSNPGMELTAKRWPLERYRELARRLVHELGAEVILIGGSDDAALNERLLEGMPAGAIIDLAGKTSIGQLAAQLERCALFIGNDSSPMHLAAAVGIPVIAIFGPTSPEEYGPYPLDDPRHIALWHHLSGRPCFFLGKMQSCAHCTCMQAVTIEEVWSAVRSLIPSSQSKEVPS
jgi:lipopolysaccharide heptosyltransferase II